MHLSPQNVCACDMELQHHNPLTEQNYARYLYATKCISAKDRLSSIVNFVSSLDLSLLKGGSGGIKYSRIRGKILAFLEKENLFVNQVGVASEYAYERVITFSNSCYTDDFVQVQMEIVNSAMSNAEFSFSPTDINIQFIEIRLLDHMNHNKEFTPIQATQFF